MYTFNVNEIIEAVKFSGLITLEKGEEKDLYDKLYGHKDQYSNNRYSYSSKLRYSNQN